MVLSLSIIKGQTVGTADSNQAPVTRQRVGIALAGGGAKGLAHIGVLRWLEENHIPIDAIAGTSMGGLVGGLYATGRTSADIERFVNNIEWDTVLGENSEYRDLNFRRKEDQQSFPASLGSDCGRDICNCPQG
jgi:NTE family protein